MTRGYFMQLLKQKSTDNEITFAVFTSGWDIGTDELVEVGQLVVNIPAEAATFSPSGPWLQDVVVESFEGLPLQPLDSHGLWTRWLLELGRKGLFQSDHLTRFIRVVCTPLSYKRRKKGYGPCILPA